MRWLVKGGPAANRCLKSGGKTATTKDVQWAGRASIDPSPTEDRQRDTVRATAWERQPRGASSPAHRVRRPRSTIIAWRPIAGRARVGRYGCGRYTSYPLYRRI